MPVEIDYDWFLEVSMRSVPVFLLLSALAGCNGDKLDDTDITGATDTDTDADADSDADTDADADADSDADTDTSSTADTATELPADSIAVGELVITEVMREPTLATEENGEWFEVFNASKGVLDLRGLVIRDAKLDTITLSGSLKIGPGDYAVLASNADQSANGGAAANYDYSKDGTLFLGNGDDELILENAGGIIDEIAWDNGLLWPDTAGQSMNLNAKTVDATINDTGSNWCNATSVFGSGDRGTPGSANDVCKQILKVPADAIAAGDLVINEVMREPTAATEADGEWFEIVNVSGGTLDLNGLQVRDNGTDSITVAGTLNIAAGAYLVFGTNSDTALNGSVNVDYVYPRTTLELGNGSDALVLQNANGVVDEVDWSVAGGFPDTAGASMSLSSGLTDAKSNDTGGNWCQSEMSINGNDLGTPGAENLDCFAMHTGTP